MMFLNWISELYRVNIKTEELMHKTATATLIIDMVMDMDDAKLRYMTKLNKEMGI